MLLSAASYAAQPTGTITGRVLNEATGQYLPRAVVTVSGTGLSGVAEYGGVYTITGVPPGEVRLSATYADLDPADATVMVTAGRTVTRDFNLTSTSYDKKTIKLGEFVVAAEREGNAKALQEQQQSLDQKIVIASDALGEIAEGNVAEFLKLMPGMMIDYTENDPRAVAIGGLGPQYAAVMMDGAPLASAGSSDIASSRAFQFEQLSIASIETIEISRTPTPDVSGSAMSGVVNMRSKGAFDRKGRSINWQVSGALNSHNWLRRTPGIDDGRSRKVYPNATIGYSNVFMDGKLGVLAGINYSLVYGEQKWQDAAYTFTGSTTDNDTEIPRLDSLQLLDSPKLTRRTNYNLRLDYKLGPNLSVWVRGDYNQFSLWTFSRNLTLRFGNPITNDPAVEYSLLSQTTANGSNEFNLAGGAFLKNGFTGTYSSGLYYKRNAFTAELNGSYSLATNWYDDLPYGYFWTGSTGQLTGLRLRWDRSNADSPAISVSQQGGADWRNLASYTAPANPQRNARSGEDQKWTALANFRYAANSWRVPMLLKWGGSMQQSIRRVLRPINGQTYTYLGPDLIPGSGDERWPAEPTYRLATTWGGNLVDLPAIDRFAMGREFRDHPERFLQPTESTRLQQRLQNRWKTKEQIDGLYFQPIVKVTPQFDIAPGVRWERTRGVAQGPNDIGDPRTRQILTGSSTGTVATTSPDYIQTRYGNDLTVPASYDTWLRYLHLNYRIRRNLLFRFGFNNSITRPPLNQLAGGIAITDDTSVPPRARVPNPDLLPEISRNLLVSLDYYFAKGAGSATITATRRDLSNLIRSTVFDIPVDGDFGGDPQWAGWQLTSTDNIGKAHVSGLEFDFRRKLDFLPGHFRRFSMFANYTRLFFDDYENFRRPRQLANGGLAYSWRDLSASWNVNFNPKFRRAATPANGWAQYDGERLRHDLRINYRLPRNVALFLTANNVFNTPTKLIYGSGERFLLRRYSDYGANWTLGVKGTF